MSDSVLSETIQTAHLPVQDQQPIPSSFGEGTSVSLNVGYFRHKGKKVKFADIEQAILETGLVKNSRVFSEENNEGDKKLVAYIIPGEKFKQEEIENILREKLPGYMVPAAWIYLEKFPLLADGSVDGNALQTFDIDGLTTVEYVAPRNETETRLVAIIQKILTSQVVGIKDNFFRLGGNSMKALQVMAAIRKELQIDLDIKYFFLYPTIEGLAEYLQIISGNNAAGDLLPSASRHCGAIIPIKQSGTKMPLYIVCGGGGTAFTFEKFANLLDKDQPVYGFQQPSDINELESFPDTIAEIAAVYVNEILLIDPDGPYALSGHCIGGVIALEMARMLEDMGREVKLLAMFDVILSKREKVNPATLKNLYHLPTFIKKAASKAFLKVDFETFLLTRHPKDAVEYKIKSIKSLVNKFYKFQEQDTEMMVFKQFEQKFEKAFENYQVNKYDGDILVFYARDHYHFLDKNRNIRFKKFLLEEEVKNIWKDYARSVKIYEMEGEHSSMFEPFYSNNFASLLQQHLDACTKE